MTLTRRGFAQGGAALAAAAIVPSLPAAGQGAPKQGAPDHAPLKVRRSIADLVREQSPIVESYRRAVGVMMQRDVVDKTSWWFQANIHNLPDDELAKLKSLERYWRQCPHKNYFFLSWHRAYLYFYERIVRKASGDPEFTLPYWAYDDPQQAMLPIPFLPDDDEMGKDAVNPALSRRNPLARANRMEYVERRWIALSNVATDLRAVMTVERFATDDKLDAQKVFGGVRSPGLQDEQVAAGIEAAPHNLVHRVMGLQGDLGSPETAARDPIFWLHHANVDRLWVKWTDPARGRVPPVDDDVWMKTKFTFVDEDGKDRILTGEELLDTQFQLGYRYDDDPPRSQQLNMKVQIARAPGGGPSAKGVARIAPSEPVVVARGGALTLASRESQVALAAAPRPARPAGAIAGVAPTRLRVVLRDVVASDRTPPYDVYLVADGQSPLAAGANAVRLGGIDLFGGAGHGAHAHHGGEMLVFEATDAMAQLTGGRGFDASKLRVAIVRRGFAIPTGEFVPDDPDPPKIGAIELLQS